MPSYYSKFLLSSSVSGSNIAVTGSSPITNIHTTLAPLTGSSGSLDEIYLYGCNNNPTASVNLTLYWGNTGSADQTVFTLSPIQGRTLLVDGKLLSGGLSVSASTDTGSVLIDGFVNRITDTSVDPFVLAWAQRVGNYGGAYPSASTLTALTTFYQGLQSTGLLAKMVMVNCFVPDNLTASLVPLIRGNGYDVWLNVNFTSSDLGVNGLKGDGSTRYLNTGFIPASAFYDDASVGMTLYNTFPDTSTAVDFGCQGSSFSELGLYADEGGFAYYSAWDETSNGITSGSVPASTGYVSGNRISATDLRLYYASSTVPHQQIGNTTTGTANTRTTLSSTTAFIFSQSSTNSPVGTKSKKRFSFAAIHKGLTGTESLIFFTLIQTLRQNLGGGYV